MIEQTVIANLVCNEEYCRKVFPYLKEEYFDDPKFKVLFSTISEYVNEYKEPPSKEALKISVDKRNDLNEDTYKEILTTVDDLKLDKETNQEWLVNETETFCQQQDIYNAIRRSILILDGKEKELDKGAIPKLLSDSLSVSFDNHIGHDFLEDFQKRHEYYNLKEVRIPTDIDLINKITKGGFPKKSMSTLLATTGGGKSLIKCHIAANSLMYGKNVLYISMELSEEEVGRRIDANIMEITLDEVKDIPLKTFEKRVSRYKEKTPGKLIIKEYPTGSAHAGHFRHLMNELKLKKNFVPDIVLVDYLNICSSSRIRGANAANSYTLVKSISEEIRGLAIEFNTAIITSSQLNRDGYGNSEVDLTNTSESMGISHTSDFILALISNEELESMNQLLLKQLKNRWGDISYYRKFLVGVDRSRMKIYNLENSSSENIINENMDDDKPVMDSTEFGTKWDERSKFANRKKNFGDKGVELK